MEVAAGVFSKLRNTLSSTVDGISAALPGNPLLREYDTGIQVGSAGPRFLWKIYRGTKKSTKADVSIWILEKKQLDEFNRSDRELILEILRKGCLQMTKLKHPRILTVDHAMEESRDSIVFCTEAVFGSLGNVLGKINNIYEVPKELMSFKLHEVEIKYGLMQISEALSFLHSSVHMIHGNLCPESVIINKSGSWKLAAFDFCVSNSGTLAEPTYNCKDWDTSLPEASLPNPNYLAPEYIVRKSCSTSSDLYSLGVLLYAVYYNGRSLFECGVKDIYRMMPKQADQLENLSPTKLEKIPSEVRSHEKMLLSPDPNVRPDADQMAKLPFFEHVGVMTLQYLDTLLQRENLQKSQFFKGLPKVLPQLPKRVVIQRVLPCLTSEFSNHDMIPFVLPNILTIAEDCTNEEFTGVIFPHLIPVFMLQQPIQILLIFLQKMELLLLKTPPDKVKAHILPMLGSALDAPSNQIQELCLSIIPTFSERLDLTAMKSNILPRIRKIFLEGGTTAIRIHALVCIGKILPSFDKWFVQDEVVPYLHKIKSREPGILMAMLGIYQVALKTDRLGLTKEVMATKCLPFLIVLSIDNNLNLKQYSSFMVVIKEMLQRVEKEQSTKLEQLSRMQIEQDAALSFTKGDVSATKTDQAKIAVDDFFTQSNASAEPIAKQQSVQHHQLSLEDKQRLAQMKEQERRMKKEGGAGLQPLNIAKPPPPKQPMNKTKDLTSTLMQSNLSSMSSRSVRPTQPMQHMTITPRAASHNNQSFAQSNAQPFNSQPPMMQQFGPMSSSPAWQQTSHNMNGTMPNSMSTSSSFPIQSNPFMRLPAPSMPSQHNTSSLDSLLNMPSQQQRPPMQGRTQGSKITPTGNMMSPQGSMMTPSATPYSSAVNHNPNASLSKQDLLDFLG